MSLKPGWTRVELREIVSDGPCNGYSPKSEQGATGTLTLKLSATTSGRFILNDATTKRIHEIIAADSKFWLRSGDILIQRANTLEYVGTTALFTGPPNTYIYPDLMMRVRAGPAVDPVYLATFLNAPETRTALREKATGTAGNMPKVNGEAVRTTLVDLPPLGEQRRIVAKLDALQTRSRGAREALDAVPPLLEKLRQSILAAAFRGDLTKDWRAKNKEVEPASKLLERIRAERRKKWEESELAKLKAKGKPPTDDKWKSKYKRPEPVDTTGLPELPDGWCWASVDELSTRVTDGTHQSPAFSANGIPFIVIANVINGAIDWLSVSKWVSRETYEENTVRCVPQRGDVLYTAVGTYGIALTVDTDEPFMFQRHIAHIKPIASLIRPDALAMLLNAPQSGARADQVARGVAQKTVTLGELSRFPIPVASSDEQTRIVEVAQELLASVTRHERRLSELARNLTALERSALAKAFRGELVPQVSTDGSADVMTSRERSGDGDGRGVEAPPGAKEGQGSLPRRPHRQPSASG